jgi:hypothetical protein
MGTTVATQEEAGGDDEAETYLRAKKHIDTLHKAKKYEKALPLLGSRKSDYKLLTFKIYHLLILYNKKDFLNKNSKSFNY